MTGERGGGGGGGEGGREEEGILVGMCYCSGQKAQTVRFAGRPQPGGGLKLRDNNAETSSLSLSQRRGVNKRRKLSWPKHVPVTRCTLVHAPVRPDVQMTTQENARWRFFAE